MKGIRLHVLRAPVDSTNGGVTATARTLVLLDDRIDLRYATHEPSEREPAFVLTETARGYKVLIPFGGWPARSLGPMAGGNYAVAKYGEDAQAWHTLLGHYGALPVHDRFETTEEYEALSR